MVSAALGFGWAIACAPIQPTEAQIRTGACRGNVGGVWLATIRDGQAKLASRALLTLHGDGSILVIDSRQHHGVQGAAFSAQAGTYRCTGLTSAHGRTLNFGFPKNPTIARSDWTLRRGKVAQLVGSVTLTIYTGVDKVDPTGPGGRVIGTFRFVATPVRPR